MTEQEWLSSEDPAAMLRARQREWEKGGVYYEGIPDAKLRVWVEACRESEGDAGVKWSWNLDLPTQLAGAVREWAGDGTSLQYVSARAALLRCMVGNPFRPLTLHEDCGRPGCEVLHKPRYLVPHVLGLAADIRERADWRLMPLLADALEEAGCPATVPCPECGGTGSVEDDGDGDGWICAETVPHPLIAHLRDPGPHGRGCHALDLILG